MPDNDNLAARIAKVEDLVAVALEGAIVWARMVDIDTRLIRLEAALRRIDTLEERVAQFGAFGVPLSTVQVDIADPPISAVDKIKRNLSEASDLIGDRLDRAIADMEALEADNKTVAEGG